MKKISRMGAILSHVPGFSWAAMDTPDPATGLTPREKQLVVKTWALVKTDLKGNGIELFIMFFQEFPEYQKKFNAFANLKLDELPSNPKLAAHATAVMYAMSSLVDQLDDPSTLVELLKRLGENHGRRGIAQQAFLDLKSVILKLLEKKLGDRLGSNGTEAWSKTLDVINNAIFTRLEQGAEAVS